MNYCKKFLIMLTLAACIATDGIAQDNLDVLIGRVKQFERDLKIFKQCRGTAQGCPADVKQRLTMAAKAIAAGTVVVLAVTGAGIAAGVYTTRQDRLTKEEREKRIAGIKKRFESRIQKEHNPQDVEFIEDLTNKNTAAALYPISNQLLSRAALQAGRDIVKLMDNYPDRQKVLKELGKALRNKK